METSRRSLLELMTVGTVSVIAGAAFRPAVAVGAPAGAAFPQGVASADPEPESVMLWTRVGGGGRADMPLVVQLSESADFARVLVEQPVLARAALDHSVRVIVAGLQPARHFFFRFLTVDGAASATGRTRTAPDPGTAMAFRFASVSCQNFQSGRYHAYRTLLERDRSGEAPLDFVLFLGDFIYELVFRTGVRPLSLPGRSWDTSDGVSGRPLSYQYAETLDDYRFLYRTYISDPWLQAARARWPFLCIWDDHEFSNDCWQSMATYTDAGEPSQRRRVAASQAWFEYVPARLTGPLAHDFVPTEVVDAPFGRSASQTADAEPNNRAAIDAIALPRKLRWGQLADIFLTDSRSYRSEPPLAPAEAKKLSLHARALLPAAVIADADRGVGGPAVIAHGGQSLANDRHDRETGSMLGQRQAQWLEAALAESPAAWKLCASSVPLMPLTLDFRYDHHARTTVDDEVVLTIDSWAGYPSSRHALLRHLSARRIDGTVFFSGDHHMHFAGALHSDGRRVATEFCVAGISSTALGDVLADFVGGEMKGSEAAALIGGPSEEPGTRWINLSFLYGREASRRLMVDHHAGRPLSLAGAQRRLDHISYLDVRSYGTLTVSVTPEQISGRYDAFDATQIAAAYDVVPQPRYQVSMAARRDSSGMEPVFEGQRPFPFDINNAHSGADE
ncbi:alkaline phosphatase D family protein [Polymorphobacter sp.]|uniref:alkaline phosphatase D family protein n=1 Tax=Polymorphobacter sp. TaxID=1909290 RepID=UPI003F72AE26